MFSYKNVSIYDCAASVFKIYCYYREFFFYNDKYKISFILAKVNLGK